jgi:hypothetical protein
VFDRPAVAGQDERPPGKYRVAQLSQFGHAVFGTGLYHGPLNARKVSIPH